LTVLQFISFVSYVFVRRFGCIMSQVMQITNIISG